VAAGISCFAIDLWGFAPALGPNGTSSGVTNARPLDMGAFVSALGGSLKAGDMSCVSGEVR
jgi:hypothetical protein